MPSYPNYCTLGYVQGLRTGKTGSSDDNTLMALIGNISRMVDRECEVPLGYFGATPAGGTTTIHYNGDGTQWLDVDDFDTITDVKMYIDQRRLTVYQMTTVPPASPGDPLWVYYVTPHPIDSPPYDRLFYPYGWFVDAWGIGNISVSGTRSTPADITHATAVWVVYAFNSIKTGWQDTVLPATGGIGGMAYKRGIPEESSMVFDYYLSKWSGRESPQVRENREQHIESWLGFDQ